MCRTPSEVSWVVKKCPWKMPVHAASLGQKYAQIQLMISLKPRSQMKIHEIPSWDLEEIFLAICGSASKVFWVVRKCRLKLKGTRHTFWQACAKMNISCKPGNIMEFREIPIWVERENFPMNYGRPSETSYGACGICSKSVVHTAALWKNMCNFKRVYLTNQETKWKSVKYPFELTERPFQWVVVDSLKLPVVSTTSI